MIVLQFANDVILFLNNTDGLSFKIQSYMTIFSLLTKVGHDLSIATQI